MGRPVLSDPDWSQPDRIWKPSSDPEWTRDESRKNLGWKVLGWPADSGTPVIDVPEFKRKSFGKNFFRSRVELEKKMRDQIYHPLLRGLFGLCVCWDELVTTSRRVDSNAFYQRYETDHHPDFQALSVNQNLNFDGMGTWFSLGKLQIVLFFRLWTLAMTISTEKYIVDFS